MANQEKINKTADEAIEYIRLKASTLNRANGKWKRMQERRLESRIARSFARQAEWVVKKMDGLSFFENNKAVKHIERKAVRDEIDDFLTGMPEHENIAKNVANTGGASYKKGAKAANIQLDMSKVGVSFELVNDDAVDYLRSLETLHLSNSRGSISQTTKKRILNILTDAAEQGRSYQDTAQKIRAQAKEGVFSRARAELIAVREVGTAYEEGNREMVDIYRQETGAEVQKLWITSGDNLVTPECAANEDEGWLGFNESFLSGDAAAPRASNPRCRCSTGYRQVDAQGNPI